MLKDNRTPSTKTRSQKSVRQSMDSTVKTICALMRLCRRRSMLFAAKAQLKLTLTAVMPFAPKFVLTTIVALFVLVSSGNGQTRTQDDFQLVKVADGVYAAIAKSGGLASGNAGFVIGHDSVL